MLYSHAGGKGARPKRRSHLGFALTNGVGAQVHSRQIRTRQYGEHAAEQRTGPCPDPERVTDCHAQRHAAEGNGAGDRAEKNGVSTDESANRPPNSCRRPGCSVTLRYANEEPRAIMPNAAKVSGMYKVDITTAKTVGKHVHSSTTTKISHMWLASQTGPMLCSTRRR
jgi:hypothetical protein